MAKQVSSTMNRRQFLQGATAATVGLAGMVAAPPALAAKKRITMLSWNHFVPSSDVELRAQAKAFSKIYGAEVQVDTIAHLQLAQKYAAEVSAQRGHDIRLVAFSGAWLYEKQLLPVDDIVEELGKAGGGWYPFYEETYRVNGTWRAVPWSWITPVGTYNESIFKKYDVAVPDTWADLLAAGTNLKKVGHPVGIAISHCVDAGVTFGSILWGHGGKVFDEGGQVAIRSPQTEATIEYYRELFDKAMTDEVLSWDDASNNRFILSGKGSWIHNPISPYAVAVAKKMPIAKDLNHSANPAGPAGRHVPLVIWGLGIWKFARNPEGAKAFIKHLLQPENLNKWITAGKGFNIGPARAYEKHPIWTSNPKLTIVPKQGEFGHSGGWPYHPSPEGARIGLQYILPDMVAKAIREKNTKAAIQWAEDRIVKIVEETRARKT